MTHLGPFRLVSTAGRGGNGEVYAAEHESGLPVAVKVLPRRSSAVALHEIRATAALRHPNVVQVFDYGVVPEGTPYLGANSVWYAMEWASGGTLADRAPLAWPELRRGFAGLLSALAWLHARGQLHRDLKPSNVLLPGPSDRRPGWKLTDFGLAWTRESQPSPESGTPHYMAPEQLFRGRLGPWTDLYGFGAMAWTVLTGRLAYPGKGPELLDAILNKPPAPFVPRLDVPDDVYPWLLRLLAKQPGARYQFAVEALDDMPAEDARPAPPMPMPEGGSPRVRTPTLVTPDFGVPEVPVPTDEAPLPRSPPREVPKDPPPTPIVPPPIPLVGVGAGLVALAEPPFVGHHAARRALWDRLRSCFLSGRMSRVAITGRRGFGRLRLAFWLAESAHALGLCHYDVVTHSGTADDGLVGWMRRVFGLKSPTRSDRKDARAAIQAWIEGRRPDAKTEAWVALVEALDAEGPRRVILVDDAEQSAATSEFLAWVAEQGDRPWLVVEIRKDPAGLPEVHLDPLPKEDLVALGRGLGLSPVAATRLAEMSHGSPGVFVDLCVLLTERKAWIYAEHGLEMRGSLDPTDSTASLWVGASRALLLAAVMAPEIHVAEWQEGCRLLGLDPVAELPHLLAHVVGNTGTETWRFRDPATARTVLLRIRDLRPIHAVAAQVVRGDDAVADERRAAHQVAAGLYAPARPALIRAAERAIARYDMPALERTADRLASAAGDDPAAKACERFCRAKLAIWRGQPGAALLEEAEAAGSPEWVVRARLERALLAEPGPRSPESRALAEAARALAVAACGPAVQVEAGILLAKLLLNPDPAAALAHVETVLAEARALGEDRWIGEAATIAGVAELFLHRPEAAEARFLVALDAATRADLRGARGVVLSELANVHQAQGRLADALAEFEESAAELGRLGHKSYAIVEASRAMLEQQLGRDDDARRRLEATLYLARSRKQSIVGLIQLALLQWDARERAWARWDERMPDVRRILEVPWADPQIARVAEAVALAAMEAGEPRRADEVLAIARHVRPE